MDTWNETIAELCAGKSIPNKELTCVNKWGGQVPVLLSFATLRDEQGAITEVLGIMKDISDCKQAQDELLRQHALLNSAGKLANVGSFNWEFESNTVSWSDQLYRIHGYEPGEVDLTVEFVREHLHPDDRKQFDAVVQQRSPNDGREDHVYRIRRKDGSERIIDARSVIERNKEGVPVRRYGVVMDITERERAAEALRASEQRFRSLVENANDIVYSVSPDGTIAYASPNTAALIGWAASDLVGQPYAAFIHPEDLPACDAALEQLLSTGECVANLEHRVRNKSGAWTWHVSNLSVLRDDSGQIAACLGISRDITERKQAEESLRASEARFRGLFEHMSSGVAVYEAVENGANFVFTDLNPAAERIDKLRSRDVLGKCITEVFPGVAKIGLLDALQRVWRSGVPEYLPESEYRDAARAGVWRENWVYRLPGGDVVAVYNDVTERRMARAAAEEHSRFLQMLIDEIPSAVFWKARDGIYGGCNATLCEWLGREHHEIVGHGVMDVYPRHLAEVYRSADERLLANPAVSSMNIAYDTSTVLSEMWCSRRRLSATRMETCAASSVLRRIFRSESGSRRICVAARNC